MNKTYQLIIIGGGAAALAAADYALDKQLAVVAIYEDVGGKAGTQQHIHGHSAEPRAGSEAARLFERRITACPGATLRDRVIGLARAGSTFTVETQFHGALTAQAVILATGATPLRLDVPGARALVDHGIGYSITTHARLAEGRNVAVIGTTKRAINGVVELARCASHIYLIAPDSAALSAPAAHRLRQLPNVQMLAGYAVREIAGAESVEQIVVERDGEHSWLPVDLVFADLGLLPNSGLVRPLAQVDSGGFVVVDDRNATTRPGLFAAGDVTNRPGEHMVIALGDGARAAASAYDYILAHPLPQPAAPAD
jgi:thioredoxin reductase